VIQNNTTIPIYQGLEADDQLARINWLQSSENRSIEQAVARIIEQVKTNGDLAIRELGERFGDAVPDSFLLSPDDIQAAVDRMSPNTKQLLQTAADNIRVFAEAVIQAARPVHLNRGTFEAGLDWKPVERVACYVPGGRYPLPSTALMTAITAQVAGVPNICIVSPSFCDEVILAGTLAGVNRFYRMGGAQAVAALAYGTESIEPVDMLVGPGNAYVTEAKKQLLGVIGIDMLAGPSEVAIIADALANPQWVALDLLAQAEHDPLARAYLLTDSELLAQAVCTELQRIMATENGLPDYLRQADWGAVFVLPTLDDCVEAVNQIAPEHLELLVGDPDAYKPRLTHYGALFMGYYTPVPYGDYMAGPNHTLPTGRTARFSGCLSPMIFLRPQSWIKATQHSQNLAKDASQFAALEGLRAHALSAAARQAESSQ
jgi:histidinol dehydrogenase